MRVGGRVIMGSATRLGQSTCEYALQVAGGKKFDMVAIVSHRSCASCAHGAVEVKQQSAPVLVLILG